MNELHVVDGRNVVSHSMIKTFRRCPQQFKYKNVDRLKPRVGAQPLERGKWVHSLFEAHYRGDDWTTVHKQLTARYAELFDEEKEALGDLPTECARIMRSYLWHYAADPAHGWKVHEVEFVVECELPDGSLYRGKVDLLAEDEFGLWIVDHKTHKSLPNGGFRARDPQSALYIKAAHAMGIPVAGFVWNYVRTTPPSEPKLAYAGTKRERLSKQLGETDYPTLYRGIKALGLDVNDYRPQLLTVQRDRWAPGKTQTSPFFRRDVLEKDSPVLERMWREAYHTHRRMLTYNFDVAERVTDRSCDYMCSFDKLCASDLYGHNSDNIIRQQFRKGDPNDYDDEWQGRETDR